MGLTERKLINNGSWLSKNLYMPLGGDWGNVVTGAAGFATNALDAFGPVKSANTLMNEAGTSTGYGSGFSYVRQNSPNYGKELAELSRLNTLNTLKTATAGATLGASFGPIGAGIGFLAGGALGLIGGGSRKDALIEQMKTAKLNTNAVNEFAMSSGLTDFLLSDYNTKYNTRQSDLIFGAVNGKLPEYKEGKPDAMLSNGEVMGHVNPSTGLILDAEKVGYGIDFNDSIPKHLGKDTETRSSFVLPQKISPLTGVSPAEYAIKTGDVKGGLLMYKDMKEYLRYRQLWNGKLPMFSGGKLSWMTAPDGPKPGELGEETKISLMPQHPNEYETYKKLIGASDLSDDRGFPEYVLREDTTGSKRTSPWLPAALGALGIATAYQMMPKENPYTADTYASNPYEQQIRSTMARRKPNSYAQYAAMRDVESRGKTTLRQMGTSIGGYLPAAIAQNIGLQRNWANVLGANNDKLNQYLGEQANMDYQLGSNIAQRRMNSNQFLSSMLARSASQIKTHRDNALAQMLGQAQYGYKNIFDLNKWQDTMGLYDRDYALRRDELRRRPS